MKKTHDGDCDVFRACGICTCGYILETMRENRPVKSEELGKHMFFLAVADRHARENKPIIIMADKRGEAL